MGLYCLLGIVALMLAALVVTRDPEENSDSPKARKRTRAKYVSRPQRESWSAVSNSPPR